MIKKGISDKALPLNWRLEESLNLLQRLGYDGVELNVQEEKGFLTLATLFSEARILVHTFNEFSLEVPSLSTSLHNQYPLNSSHSVIRMRGEEIALKMIELAASIGAQIIQIVPEIIVTISCRGICGWDNHWH